MRFFARHEAHEQAREERRSRGIGLSWRKIQTTEKRGWLVANSVFFDLVLEGPKTNA